MIHNNFANQEVTSVNAYDFETKKFVGFFENTAIASRKLFIRSSESIWLYVKTKHIQVSGKPGRPKSGVKSYKGQVYHFELAKPE